jgi:hypothetical protein
VSWAPARAGIRKSATSASHKLSFERMIVLLDAGSR